jgi:hypothetical protein
VAGASHGLRWQKRDQRSDQKTEIRKISPNPNILRDLSRGKYILAFVIAHEGLTPILSRFTMSRNHTSAYRPKGISDIARSNQRRAFQSANVARRLQLRRSKQ